MKAAAAFVLGGLGILLALPLEAQHGGRGGFSVRGGSPRVSGGASVRMMSPPPTVVHMGRVSPPQRLGGRSSSAPVVVLRQNFQPRSVSHMVLRGPIGQMRPIPVVRHPIFVDRPFVHFRFRHFHHGFGFPFCSPVFGIGFGSRDFGFSHRELACFPRPFFFPFAPVAGSTFLVLPPSVVYAQEPFDTGQQMGEASGSYQPSTEAQPPGEAAAPSKEGSSRPLTLLQLKDGSMYGLTDYWLEDGRLHYITSYGGENSVPLERIDFDRTVQLNWERGVEFVLRPKPSTR